MIRITPQQNSSEDLTVEVVGAALMRHALENYLEALPGLTKLQGKNKAHKLVLIVGQEGQEYVKHRCIRRQACPRKVCYALLTSGTEIDYALARDLPISSFIANDDPPETFLEGLRAAAEGIPFCSPCLVPAFVAAARPTEKAVSPALTFSAGASGSDAAASVSEASKEQPRPAPLSEKQSGSWKEHPFGLSAREAEIVSHAAHGLSNTEIASTLYVSLPTIKFHLYRAYQKIGIQRRSQLAGVLAAMN